MMILEYRLWKDDESYVPLYHYEDIQLEQILARRECEFFVKEGVTYKQLSSSVEGSIVAIYVEQYEKDLLINKKTDKDTNLRLEIRELNPYKKNPLLEERDLSSHMEVLLYIGSVYTYVNQLEWERDSAELDEDQLCYILYVTPTGYKWEGDFN